MRVATWNLNSVKARESHLLDWLGREKPDVLCWQELKLQTEAFPNASVEKLGYHSAVYGQKSYNGVAILSNVAPDTMQRGFEENDSDDHARLIHAQFGKLHVISAYFPNGNEVGSDKFKYKLSWMQRLTKLLPARFDLKKDWVVLGGDFNVAPRDEDIRTPKRWRHTVLACDEVRDALCAIRKAGMVDAVEPFFPHGGPYTWWDYRMGGFEHNEGLRIDHLYVSPALAKWVVGARVDRAEREKDKPSDHIPVSIELDIDWKTGPLTFTAPEAPKSKKKQLGLDL